MMRELERSRAPGRSAAQTLDRIRGVYVRVPPRARLVLFLAALVGSGVAAASLEWPVGRTVLGVALALGFCGFALRYPRAAATAAVFVLWLGLVLLLDVMVYQRAVHDRAAWDAIALVALGVCVCAASHLTWPFSPWRTAALALCAAAVVGAAGVLAVPAAEVIPAYVAAAGVLVYRWIAARRRIRAGAYEAEYDDAHAGAYPAGAHPSTHEASADEVDEPPPVSVDEALAELEGMIGLEPVKRQVHAVAASIEAARLRAQAGYATEKPMRHFVFLGPPGTGKTTVARTVARIFHAFGLLPSSRVVEAQRVDLVAEYLGGTAVKTNQLIDGALGGVLFIDEAYGLVNSGDGQGDRFGAEATATLLKRAEDDRDNLVVILAGYEREMEEFLAANPGLGSRFSTRVTFPSYTSGELLRIAEYQATRRGERLDAGALSALESRVEEICRRGIVDELGNGRFVRSLVEAAASARDVRVMGGEREPSPELLVTILAEDVERAYAEVTARFRGYADTPSLEDALAELDELVGLEPVRRQVHAIAAQLRVARVRRTQGLPAAPPMRHFVFAGPPGTGKTTVARILGRVLAALGLLARPDVVEAQRADLVGEYLGATAVKTNQLIDGALGGVLFIDEAYALLGDGYAGGDAFGAEAVTTLLKRAEDDRDRLVVILAGYEREMDRFLAANPGLASRFSTRVTFPSYDPRQLRAIAELLARQSGDHWDADALADLDEALAYVHARGLVDELGNGRFARSLYEEASARRDLRLAAKGDDVTSAELTTLTRDDLRAAYAELTARFR